jgi:hypothetical protein
MARPLFVALATLVVACGTDDDERPVTLEVVTLTVLAPSCGQVQCHSTTTKTEQLAFDTVDDARASLIDLEVKLSVAVNRPLENDLMNVLLGDGLARMPPDSPLADQDIALIRAWLVAGAPGL